MKKKITAFALGTCFKLIYLPVICTGQLFTNNGAQITSSAQVTVKGDVQHNAGASMSNSGIIELTGNWTNNSGNNCFGNSAGTVLLNGSNQSIGGNSATVFNNLTLGGSGTKTLLHDETVGGAYVNATGILSLSDRFLELNSHQLTITNTSPLAITRSSGFIQSETDPGAGYSFVKWMTGNAPAGAAYSFPFGNIASNSFIPFNFTISIPGNGASGSISAATYPTDPTQSPNNRPLPLGVNALLNTGGTENADKTVDRFWLLHANDYITPPVSTLTFTYRDGDWMTGTNAINEANLQSQKLNGNTWSYPMMGWDNPAANSVTVSNVPAYDTIWTLADNSAPLPVSLISFDAELQRNESVLCSWITAAQINNDHFEVERSKDGYAFSKIGTLEGAGNSTMVLNYSFVDNQPLQGLSYYRLKQVDYDGRSTYSEIRAVMTGMKGIKYVAYPNPATANLNLMFSENVEFEGTLRMVDATGNVALERNITIHEHEQLVGIDVSSLASGHYLLQLISPQDFVQQKIAVVN